MTDNRTALAERLALDVFRIAGGDAECEPRPTAERALEVLRDLRKCYDEALRADAGGEAVARPPNAEIHVGNGHFAICDWADWDLVKGLSWYLSTSGRAMKCQYAQARIASGADKRITMHRLIMQPPEGFVVDHINCNGLDNRRANLRLATLQQNAFNRRNHPNATSNFKGVSFESRTGMWRAHIKVDGRKVSLRRHGTEMEAAMAYNLAAKEYFGEYANLNEVD